MSGRLVIVCEFSALNGGERSLLSVLPAVIAAGWQPIALCPACGPLAEAIGALGIEVVSMEIRDASGVSRERSAVREELAEQLVRLRPTLLHANSLAMGRLAGPVAREAAIPSIAHLRDIATLSRAAIGDLNRHTRLLAVSFATRDALVEQGVDAKRTYALYNGIDLDQFRPRTPTGWLHRGLGLPPRAQLIGCIGQIILRKGQDVLAEAAALMAERCPDAHFLFIGVRHSPKSETIALEESLIQAFSTPRLRGRGHFLGVRDDIPHILNELCLFVHAARQEPLGRVLLEAAAAGCAIVCTNVGGTREIFPSGDEAVLVAPHDPGVLAEAIANLIGDPARRAALGKRARERIAAAFDIRYAAVELLAHYNAVADRSY